MSSKGDTLYSIAKKSQFASRGLKQKTTTDNARYWSAVNCKISIKHTISIH
jgi:hypothetical protein